MSQTPVPITGGTGSSSIAAELVAGTSFQQIEVYGGGGASVLSINPDGSINASIIGSPTIKISGNPSVSGTVGASVIGAVPVNIQGSVAAVIIGGSIAATFTPPANQSVSGTVGASVIGIVPVQLANASVISYIQNSVAAVIIGGSIAASFTPPANQSVSGTVGASIIGLPPFVLGGSTNASVITVGGSGPANQSVSGTVGASIVGQLPAGTAMLGSVVAYQGVIPWTIGSVYGNISGSVFAVVQGLQGASVSGTVGASVIGTVPVTITNASVSGIVGASIIGIAPVLPAVYAASVQGVTSVITGTTSVLVLGAPSGTNRNYITHVLVTNGAAVSTQVTIQDGASILWGGFAAASGGGWSETFNPPLPQPTSVKALYVTSSTQASVIVGVSGFTGA